MEVGVHTLTDVHEDTPLDEVKDVVSVLQTPPSYVVRLIISNELLVPVYQST